MYEKIVVAYDGSPESRFALSECCERFAGTGVEVHLVGVVKHPEAFFVAGEFLVPNPSEDDPKKWMAQELEAGHAALASRGLRVVPHLELGEPVDVIARIVDSLAADLVIVGHSRHKSFAARWWRGSMDAILVDRIRCSLLIASDARSGR